MNWDQYFITMTYVVASKSKDPSTKIGAIIVGNNHEIRSTGYNGFPRGVLDIDMRYHDKNQKYAIINHAEENAILHCARVGISAEYCTLYTQWIPCIACAKLIIQVGIKQVVYHEQFPGNTDNNIWKNSINLTRKIFDETKVELIGFSGEILQITGLYNGQLFDPT